MAKNLPQVISDLKNGKGVFVGSPLFVRDDGSVVDVNEREQFPASALGKAAYDEYMSAPSDVFGAISTHNEDEGAHAGLFGEVDEKIAFIETIIEYDPSIDDYTATIQSALDKKGLIKIVGAGVYTVARLYIGSDTTLELGPGVVFKRKSGTNHHILVNKGHVSGVRDKNIVLRGGVWNLNREENPSSPGNMSIDPQSNPGIGIVFRFVDNLTIENIEQIGNEWKYCYLIVDSTNLKIRNVYLVNESDGFHFEPPIRNMFMENITGNTQDDLISFTCGDYPSYALGNTGDIENIYIRNVYGELGSVEIIKIVGSGIDGTSVFRNMKFENISGHSSNIGICILKEDQSVVNPYLLNTRLENVVFENVDIKMSGQNSYFRIGAASGDLTLRKIKGMQSGSIRPILLQKCGLDQLVIDDFTYDSSSTNESVNWIIRVENTGIVLKNLIIKNSMINATAGNYCVTPNSDSVERIVFENCKINTPTISLVKISGTASNPIDIYISNSDINASIIFETSVKITGFISNSKIVTSYKTCYMSDGAEVYIKSGSSDIEVTVNSLGALRKLSLKGDISTALALSTLFGRFGDTVLYYNGDDPANSGKYFYNLSGTWVKIA